MTGFFSEHRPVKTLRPESHGEIQEIIRQANKEHTPLVPVSSGTNLQDTHLPSVKGVISVDLSRLNKIVYLDARNRNAVIEPGVTFHQLETACEAQGLKTLTAIDVPKEASVLGTYLQNARVMEVIYREGYTDIEMEAGPYLSGVSELFRPTRHPVNEIVNLYGLPFELGILHYASDTPLTKGENLGAGTLSYFGVDSTYATSLVILRRIMQREYDRVIKRGYLSR